MTGREECTVKNSSLQAASMHLLSCCLRNSTCTCIVFSYFWGAKFPFIKALLTSDIDPVHNMGCKLLAPGREELAISANISLLELSACIVEIAPGDPEGPRHENSGATTWLLITGP